MTNRELDILVGTKIFGLQISTGSNGFNCIPRQLEENCPSCGYDAMWNESALPNYSSDISHAWMVVDKMRSLKKYVYVLNYVDDFFRCEIREYTDKGDTLISNRSGDSPSQAICLAALEAVGVDVK